MRGYTMDVICSTGFGVDVNSQRDPDNPFIKYAKEFFEIDVGKNPIFLLACKLSLQLEFILLLVIRDQRKYSEKSDNIKGLDSHILSRFFSAIWTQFKFLSVFGLIDGRFETRNNSPHFLVFFASLFSVTEEK